MLLPLPSEIIHYHLLPLLGPRDIVNLCLSGLLDATREVYQHIFHDPTFFAHYTAEMLQQRMDAKVYVFGEVGTLSEYPEYPTEVKENTGGILKVRVNNGSVVMISLNGEVFFTEDGYVYRMPFSNEEMSDDISSFDKYDQHGWDESYHEHFIGDGPRFLDATYYDRRLYGVDRRGMMWADNQPEPEIDHFWLPLVGSYGPDYSSNRAPTNFFSHPRHCEIRMSTDEFHGSTWYRGEGIVKWSLLSSTVYRPPCHMFCEMELVPQKDADVCDYVSLDKANVFVCLHTDGTVSSELRAVPMDKLNRLGPFKHISGRGEHLCLLRCDGQVVEARLKHTVKDAHIVEGLADIASVSAGSTHSLALTQNGQVYSWGKRDALKRVLRSGSRHRVNARHSY